jgi:hypothetical protein
VLQLQVPPIPLEGHVLKYGSAVIAAQFASYQGPPRQHPVMQAAQELVELLQLLGLMEGQSPQAVAGGCAVLAAPARPPAVPCRALLARQCSLAARCTDALPGCRGPLPLSAPARCAAAPLPQAAS